ncbi:hypothetical protein ACSBR1_028741 [Camellia fascicularis]
MGIKEVIFSHSVEMCFLSLHGREGRQIFVIESLRTVPVLLGLMGRFIALDVKILFLKFRNSKVPPRCFL